MHLYRVTKKPEDGLWVAQRWLLDGDELTLVHETSSDTRQYAFGRMELLLIEDLQEAGH